MTVMECNKLPGIFDLLSGQSLHIAPNPPRTAMVVYDMFYNTGKKSLIFGMNWVFRNPDL